MKRCLFFVLMLCANHAFTQKTFDHELQLTETKFALESQVHGLKWGFLHNMDTNALGIGRQGYMNLYKSWESRTDVPGFTLLWKPAIVFWSEDGLFGVTSGPYYSKSATDTVMDQDGVFFTIWKRDRVADPFKFVLDIGVNLSSPASPMLTRDADVRKYPIPVKKWATSNDALSAYGKVAGASSLKQALEDFSTEQTYMLFSGAGALKWSQLDRVPVINGQFTFLKIGSKQLSPSTWYEWGNIYREGVQSPNTNYFVHVWSYGDKGPRLIAAMYRID